MGKLKLSSLRSAPPDPSSLLHSVMAPMKNGTKTGVKAMSKGAITKKLAEEHGLKQKACSDILSTFVEIASQEVIKTGKFTVPGLCMIKTRKKPATKAGVRSMFGKEVKVAAKPARTVVKAFPAKALKDQI